MVAKLSSRSTRSAASRRRRCRADEEFPSSAAAETDLTLPGSRNATASTHAIPGEPAPRARARRRRSSRTTGTPHPVRPWPGSGRRLPPTPADPARRRGIWLAPRLCPSLAPDALRERVERSLHGITVRNPDFVDLLHSARRAAHRRRCHRSNRVGGRRGVAVHRGNRLVSDAVDFATPCGVHASTTDISFWVNVPVLSVQMNVVEPRVSRLPTI